MNIPLLQTRIYAFRLNTLKRLLSVVDAHWKYFTAYFLRVANTKLGKMTVVLDYSSALMATFPRFIENY